MGLEVRRLDYPPNPAFPEPILRRPFAFGDTAIELVLPSFTGENMSSIKPELTVEHLVSEASRFAEIESTYGEKTLYGVTDGKRIGTYLEHKFRLELSNKYSFELGNSASGIDFPDLGIDMKVTSIRQPQSSCPFKSARQKIFGLGYGVIVFVYEKTDNDEARTGCLNMHHTIFVEKGRTADFQTTKGILDILKNEGNRDDLMGFFEDRKLPVDEIEAGRLADEILEKPPVLGYLTISNALQWRLQYSRVISEAGKVEGIHRVW